MKNHWLSVFCAGLLAGFLLLPAWASAASDPSRGLWVGEVTVNKVNQVGVDAYIQAGVVPPGPGETTPTASQAHFRLIVHVDASGQARLLKSVAVFSQTNGAGDAVLSLVTDQALYPQFTGAAKRISAITFDFGELTVYQAITNVAGAAATAAAAAATGGATSASITTAANNAVSVSISNAVNTASPVSSNYHAFIASSQFTGPAANAAVAAAQAAYQASTNGGATPQATFNQASSAALIALTSAFTTSDALTRNEVRMDGSLSPANTVSASFFLGAFHPTNPFRHRRHPDHTQGYDIIRTVQLLTDATPTTSVSGGYGVDRLTGVYREEIQGLHKPLGPGRDIGLKTEGVFTLNRLSLVDTLNQ